MNTLRLACQRNLYQLRQFHKCIVQQQEAAATAATATIKPSVSETVSTKEEAVASSKIEQIADQIVSLNLIEVAQLSDLLKKRLNLPDAPVMPMGGFAAAPPKEEEEEVQTVVQTAFTVKLTGFDEKKKVALIKELKTILPNCNLVQAKKFVESAPAVIKSELTKEEADQLVDVIKNVGGEVEVV
ncbi:39S ribosomal protein L12, mitochondrial [Ceratina calcarata]|uniref:39S ribosomal protein L12, mitochondrial n=1 Tax=Ceratina calcarata TaxID=156304 RepID=A0AAJ7NC28_9HYME|nr:39S ribosomal protein L12, mitochondrial [Ceratina calcarata]